MENSRKQTAPKEYSDLIIADEEVIRKNIGAAFGGGKVK
jgi:hypothetical protein